jgi:hypothetical protein
LKESVKRAVRWAGEKGIQELSIWDSRGLSIDSRMKGSRADGKCPRVIARMPGSTDEGSNEITPLAAFFQSVLTTPSEAVFGRNERG